MIEALVALLAIIINAAVTYGVVTARLESLSDGVKEAKASAQAAHTRIDRVLENQS